AVVFTDNCAACHMEDGTGDRAQGAPNLTDAIWLFGGDQAALTETVTNARFGVMPSWTGRLSEADIRAVASNNGIRGGQPPPPNREHRRPVLFARFLGAPVTLS